MWPVGPYVYHSSAAHQVSRELGPSFLAMQLVSIFGVIYFMTAGLLWAFQNFSKNLGLQKKPSLLGCLWSRAFPKTTGLNIDPKL